MAGGVAGRIMIQGERGVQPLAYGPSKRNNPPLLNSAETPWAGVPFELHHTQPNEAPTQLTPVEGEYHLRVVVSGSYELLLKTPGGDLRHRGVPGTVTFHGRQGVQPLAVSGDARTMVIRLTETWLRRVLQDGSPPAGVHQVAEADATARDLAMAMCREVASGAETGSLFAESLTLALLSYALERVPLEMQARGGLSEGQCRRLRRYIQERLSTDIRLAELAELCDLQPRHFTTLFRRAFGTTPHRFLVQQRLDHGARLLVESGHDIAEIALQSGFSSQSHFTTAFRKAYGTTPKRYAQSRRVSMVVPRSLGMDADSGCGRLGAFGSGHQH